MVEPTLPLQIAALMHWPLNPLLSRADLWKEADPLTREQPTHRANMDAIDALLKQERVLGGVPTYRPLVTFAWRDKLDFTPWPVRDYWRVFQEVGWKKP